MARLTDSRSEALKLFNKKANRLQNTRFIRFVRNGRMSVRIAGRKGQFRVTKKLPDKDAIDAFVLTFRYFIQDNERCSFRNLAKVYSSSEVSKDIKNEFTRTRKLLNDFLGSPSAFNYRNQNVSKRKLMEMFIYGDLAHANKTKKKLFDQLMKNPLRDVIELEFDIVLLGVLNLIQRTARLNGLVLKSVS
jgi:hypothetical protein